MGVVRREDGEGGVNVVRGGGCYRFLDVMYQGTADASQLCPTQRPTYYFICQFDLMRPEFDVHDLDLNYLHRDNNRTRHEITDTRRASVSTGEIACEVHRSSPARLPRRGQSAEPGRAIAKPSPLPPRVRGSPVSIDLHMPAESIQLAVLSDCMQPG